MIKEYNDILIKFGLDDFKPEKINYIRDVNPFIITIRNTTGSTKYNVAFLNAAEAISDDKHNYGLATGVSGGSGYSNCDYSGIIGQLLTHDINVGAFLIESLTNSQTSATIMFRTDNQRGEAVEETLVPEMLPTWKQTGVSYMEQKMTLTAWTSGTISVLYANTTLKINIYPESMALNAAYNGSVKMYGKPNLVNLSKIF